MKGKILRLIYRKVRTAFGLSFGLILMYGVFNDIITYKLFTVAFGFTLLHLFGDCYNDYWDYEEDKSNKRGDKLTVNKVLSKEQIRKISFLILFFGLGILYFTNIFLLFTGLIYSLLLWAYSHPSVRLKKYDIYGYALTESAWLFIPLLLNNFFSLSFSNFTPIFILFYFFQYTYLLCQKDSTDLNDTTNLFIRRGWLIASLCCILFASISSISLFFISVSSLALISIWALNILAKALNLGMIYKRRIKRETRKRLVLIEFLTPYLYVGGGLFV